MSWLQQHDTTAKSRWDCNTPWLSPPANLAGSAHDSGDTTLQQAFRGSFHQGLGFQGLWAQLTSVCCAKTLSPLSYLGLLARTSYYQCTDICYNYTFMQQSSLNFSFLASLYNQQIFIAHKQTRLPHRAGVQEALLFPLNMEVPFLPFYWQG